MPRPRKSHRRTATGRFRKTRSDKGASKPKRTTIR